MKRKITILLGMIILFIAVWYIFAPQKAVSAGFSIYSVQINGEDVTELLNEATINQLEQELMAVSCNRLKLPMEHFPLLEDTVVISGMDEADSIHFYLVGSTNRYLVNDYNILNGQQLLKSVQDILG